MTISRYSLVPDPAARLFGCTKGRTDQSIGGMRRPGLRQTGSHLRDPSRAGRTAKGRHQARLRSRVQPGSANPRPDRMPTSPTYRDDNASVCPRANHITVQCHPTISPDRGITGCPLWSRNTPIDSSCWDRLTQPGSSARSAWRTVSTTIRPPRIVSRALHTVPNPPRPHGPRR